MLKVAIVRGKVLNKWEMQGYELLTDRVDITAFASVKSAFPLDEVRLRIERLHSPDYYLQRYRLLRGTIGRELWIRLGLDYMFRLEHALADYDIIHACETVPAYTYQAAKVRRRHRRVRLISTCWETIPFLQDEQHFIHRRKRYVQRHVDMFLAMTHRAKEALQLEGVEESRIRVQYPGIDLQQFRPLARPDHDDTGLWRCTDALRVLFVGSITAAKGIRELLRAAAEVAQSPQLCGHVEFGLVGHGDLVELIPHMISRLGLEGIVSHIPSVPYSKMPALFASADLFVLPSIPTPGWEEQFGLVLAESMACGKAIITTRSGAIPEVVGNAAVLVAPGDYCALAQAMANLLLDEGQQARLSAAAASRARNLFDPHVFASRVLKIYEELYTS